MTVAVNVSHFEGVTMAPPYPILGVFEAIKADTNDLKLNLGVGAYRTKELQPYVLNVVKKAKKLMLEKAENKEVGTIQGLSGTGSLCIAATFIQRYFLDAKVLMSSPTWGV